MTAVFVVGAIAVVGAVIARVTWRRPADERHSIESHRQTLETLRSMADRRPGPREAVTPPGVAPAARSPRTRTGPAHAAPARSGTADTESGRSAPVRPGAAPSTATRSTSARPAPARAGSPAASNGETGADLVFVDDVAGSSAARTEGSPRIAPLTMPKGLHRSGRGGRRSFTPGGRATRNVWAVAAVVAVLAVVVGVAVALAPSHHTASPPARDRHVASHRHATHPHTTVTTPPQVKATTSTAITASYSAPTTGYTIGLAANGLCWVEATETSTGTVVWTGTLQTGQTKAIAASGNLVVRLGAANDVAVTLNGVPVVLPPGFASPFDMTFST